MNQNSVIAFALIAGFIVFITVKGELPKYLAVLGLGNASLNTSGTGSIIPGLTPGGLIPVPAPGSPIPGGLAPGQTIPSGLSL